MIKDGLVNKLKKGFKKIVLVTSAISLLSSLSCCKYPLPTNNYPQAELYVNYTSGQAPLQVNIQLDGTDLDGIGDIIQYKIGEDKNNDGDIGDYNELIKTSSNPINENVIFNTGIKKIYGQVMDTKGAIGNAGPISINVSLAPGAPTVDLSGVNTDLLEEESQKIINLPMPTDPNPEDNPVPYISATSLDGKVSIDNCLLNENKIKVTGNSNEINSYQINLKFGTLEGGISNATLEGFITNLVDISGQLQDNETDSPQSGIIKVYDSAENFLQQFQTDSLGNFDFQLNDVASEIILQAKLDVGSYVRTLKGLSGLQDYCLEKVRAVPYDAGLIDENGNQITPEEFKTHMREIMRPVTSSSPNPDLFKWDFGEFSSQYPLTEIIISKEHYDPEIQGTFTDTEIDNIKSRILNIDDINSFFEGRIQEIPISVADNYSGEEIRGKIFLFPAEHVAGYAYVFDDNADGYLDRVALTVGVPLDGEGLDSSVLAHEFGHGSGLFGHSNLSQEITIMNEIGSERIDSPGAIDKKASKIIYEDTYKGREKLNDLMGDDFY